MTWTDARIALLTHLWADGVSASGVAEALGDVSRSAVLGKLHRLGLLRSRASASAPRRYDGGPASAAPIIRPPALASPSAHAAAASPQPPQPPRSPWREAAFEPLPGTAPRLWTMRALRECAFPVGGEGEQLVSCCAPVGGRGAYCDAHHAVVFKTAAPAARAAEQRRWEAAVERWAA